MSKKYFTAVFEYDGDSLMKDPIYDRIFELLKVEGGPLRVCGSSHGNEMLRAERLEELLGKADSMSVDFEYEVEQINQQIYEEVQ